MREGRWGERGMMRSERGDGVREGRWVERGAMGRERGNG